MDPRLKILYIYICIYLYTCVFLGHESRKGIMAEKWAVERVMGLHTIGKWKWGLTG